jgi:hypothetical protein
MRRILGKPPAPARASYQASRRVSPTGSAGTSTSGELTHGRGFASWAPQLTSHQSQRRLAPKRWPHAVGLSVPATVGVRGRPDKSAALTGPPGRDTRAGHAAPPARLAAGYWSKSERDAAKVQVPRRRSWSEATGGRFLPSHSNPFTT